MKLIASTGHYLRTIKLKDVFAYTEMLWDWGADPANGIPPGDEYGPYTLARGQGDTTKAVRESAQFVYPLTEDSRFNLTVVYCEPGCDEPVGMIRGFFTGKEYELANFVIHPEKRGKGLSSSFIMAWAYLVNNVMGVECGHYEVFESSPGAQAAARRFGDKQRVSTRVGRANILLEKGLALRADVEKKLNEPGETYVFES